MTVAGDFADRVFFGNVITMDEQRASVEAVAIRGELIVSVGSRAEVEPLVGADTIVTELGTSTLMPGFVEAHGHPLSEAIFLGPSVVDIRPVVAPDADSVLSRLKEAIQREDPAGVYANGWDTLLQVGLPDPTLDWLNGLSPDQIGRAHV